MEMSWSSSGGGGGGGRAGARFDRIGSNFVFAQPRATATHIHAYQVITAAMKMQKVSHELRTFRNHGSLCVVRKYWFRTRRLEDLFNPNPTKNHKPAQFLHNASSLAYFMISEPSSSNRSFLRRSIRHTQNLKDLLLISTFNQGAFIQLLSIQSSKHVIVEAVLVQSHFLLTG